MHAPIHRWSMRRNACLRNGRGNFAYHSKIHVRVIIPKKNENTEVVKASSFSLVDLKKRWLTVGTFHTEIENSIFNQIE